MPHIDRTHARAHRIGARDPLDDFLDTISAQATTGLKTFTTLPLLGTGPSIGSHWVRFSYPIARPGSHFYERVYSMVVVRAGDSFIGAPTAPRSTWVARAGGSFIGVSSIPQGVVVARTGGSLVMGPERVLSKGSAGV